MREPHWCGYVYSTVEVADTAIHLYLMVISGPASPELFGILREKTATTHEPTSMITDWRANPDPFVPRRQGQDTLSLCSIPSKYFTKKSNNKAELHTDMEFCLH